MAIKHWRIPVCGMKIPMAIMAVKNDNAKIVEGIAKKVLSFDGVSKYQDILSAVESNMKTDMSFDNMRTIALDYRDAFKTIKQDQLKGKASCKMAFPTNGLVRKN